MVIDQPEFDLRSAFLKIPATTTMTDAGNHRWVEKYAQHQGSVSQLDMIWLTDKLTLPTAMHAKWRIDEHTAFSAGPPHPNALRQCSYTERVPTRRIRLCKKAVAAGHACLDVTLPEEMQLDGLQLQGLITSCLGRDK